MRIKYISEGTIDGKIIPVTVVFIDLKNIKAEGISIREAAKAAAAAFEGPAAINIFDMDAVTTTSDGIMAEGAIICMAASDRGIINDEFGMLNMAEIEYSEERIALEPHLKQWDKLFKGRKLYRGPNPADKIIPVHNVVISGRASNNNSATEMMNLITMDEMLFPILGQLECIRGGELLVGYSGENISVGIGMTVAEKYGRVFPHPQFHAGDTAHGSGKYAKTLKQTIPCIVCDKKTIAEYTIRAIDCGCVPARDIGCSPVVLSVARALGAEVDYDNITPAAQEELDSVGCTREWMKDIQHMSREEVIEKADELIPGVAEAAKHNAAEIVNEMEISIDK